MHRVELNARCLQRDKGRLGFCGDGDELCSNFVVEGMSGVELEVPRWVIGGLFPGLGNARSLHVDISLHVLGRGYVFDSHFISHLLYNTLYNTVCRLALPCGIYPK